MPIHYSLEISNIGDVIEVFSGRSNDFYKGPFELLSDLEKRVAKMLHPEDVVLVPYKDDGDAIFDFIEIKNDRFGRATIAVYEYATTIS